MNLQTTYMGLTLKNPLVPSASPLSEKVSTIRQLEDAGASAIVLYSIFEEQIVHEQHELFHFLSQGTESYREAISYFPEQEEYITGPEEYLRHIQETTAAVDIPVIASLNGVSLGGWVNFAKQIEQAGADALELNLYYIPTDLDLPGSEIEKLYVENVRSIKENVRIPIAVKLSPFFSSMASMAKNLDAAGADALVLFNRFYQPDFDLENLDVLPSLNLSVTQEMRLPLRWIAILYGKVRTTLAATTGIHEAEDVLKMLMAGADVTMLCSTLLHNGVRHLTKIQNDLVRWMEEHEYDSVAQMKGSMSQKSVAQPSSFERANYMKVLQSWKAII